MKVICANHGIMEIKCEEHANEFFKFCPFCGTELGIKKEVKIAKKDVHFKLKNGFIGYSYDSYSGIIRDGVELHRYEKSKTEHALREIIKRIIYLENRTTYNLIWDGNTMFFEFDLWLKDYVRKNNIQDYTIEEIKGK